MTKRGKAFLSILFLSITFYMMMDTKYLNAVGDYVVEFIGLKAWTGTYTGIHLTIFYFLPFFILALLLVRKYAIRGLNITSVIVFFVFVGFTLLFSFLMSTLVKIKKANAEGLFPIALEQDKPREIEYDFVDNEYTRFKADFTLKNYSKETKRFYLMIDTAYSQQDKLTPTELFDEDESRAVFELRGEESKPFSIDAENYLLKGGHTHGDKIESGSGWTDSFSLIVFDESGHAVKLDEKYFLGKPVELHDLKEK